MTFVDERLAASIGRARARFLEDATLALTEGEPGKSDIEEALQEQIGHGRQLLEMGEAACYLASVARLRPETHQQMQRALAVGVQAFRDLQELVVRWTSHSGVALTGEQELGTLIAEMDGRRAELAFDPTARRHDIGIDLSAFPQPATAEWGRMNQRRAELIRKSIRGELNEEERQEYENLQRLSLAAVDALCQPPRNGPGPGDPTEANGP